MQIILMSFGFKYGQPNANYYFDVGFIKNPAREKQWSFWSGQDENMRNFVMSQEKAAEFIRLVVPLISYLGQVDQKQVFAFGCSAGRHRSVIVVETIAEILRNSGLRVEVKHRDA